MADAVADGKRVSVEYVGTLDDGSEFDSTEGRQPLQFDCGTGAMIVGFERAVEGMRAGESKTFTLEPAEAYGEYDDSQTQQVAADRLPDNVEVGSVLQAPGGRRVVVTALDADGEATLDMNHELAGKALTFAVTIVAVEDAPAPFAMPEMLSQNPYDYPASQLPRHPADLLEGVSFPDETIFTSSSLFSREDESDDADFYTQPRFLTHIDDEAIAALTQHYARVFPETAAGNEIGHLDVCSSWVSFLPEAYKPSVCVGLGMNEAELAANEQVSTAALTSVCSHWAACLPHADGAVFQLTSHDVHDLNKQPQLPYEDEAFDVVTNVVSVDYLARPLELFQEMYAPRARMLLLLPLLFTRECFFSYW